jgi:hypothetical protein
MLGLYQKSPLSLKLAFLTPLHRQVIHILVVPLMLTISVVLLDLQMNHALQDEIREINHQLIDTVVDVSEDGNDAAAAAEGRDGIVLKCSYNAIALSPSMKFRYRSSQMVSPH